MPITSWPRPCPIGIATGNLHIGRVYGKKTCGGYQCVKTWRQWNFEMQSKYTNYANMTLPERLEADQLDNEIESLRAEERKLQHETPEPETPAPMSHKDRFLHMINSAPIKKEEPTNGNNEPTDVIDPNPTNHS